MRSIVLALAVAAGVAVSAPVVALAGDARQDFTLVNHTGYDIKSVYVSGHRTNSWEEDVLGDDQLDDDAKVNIHFSTKTKTCRFDLKVVYAVDETHAVWTDIDLCKVSTITLYYNKKTDKTRAEFE